MKFSENKNKILKLLLYLSILSSIYFILAIALEFIGPYSSEIVLSLSFLLFGWYLFYTLKKGKTDYKEIFKGLKLFNYLLIFAFSLTFLFYSFLTFLLEMTLFDLGEMDPTYYFIAIVSTIFNVFALILLLIVPIVYALELKKIISYTKRVYENRDEQMNPFSIWKFNLVTNYFIVLRIFLFVIYSQLFLDLENLWMTGIVLFLEIWTCILSCIIVKKIPILFQNIITVNFDKEIKPKNIKRKLIFSSIIILVVLLATSLFIYFNNQKGKILDDPELVSACQAINIDASIVKKYEYAYDWEEGKAYTFMYEKEGYLEEKILVYRNEDETINRIELNGANIFEQNKTPWNVENYLVSIEAKNQIINMSENKIKELLNDSTLNFSQDALIKRKCNIYSIVNCIEYSDDLSDFEAFVIWFDTSGDDIHPVFCRIGNEEFIREDYTINEEERVEEINNAN